MLLAGGTTMLSWPDSLCEAIALGGRHVVRYDLRDAGASTTVDPEAPAYTLRDLGGMVAQVAALDHPGACSALTVVGTRPVAPGPVDDDLPDHDAPTMERLFSPPMPDWSDRAAAAAFAAERAEILGDDPAGARAIAGRAWDRAPGTEPAVQMANQLAMVFAALDCTPRCASACPRSPSRRSWCTVAATRSSRSGTARHSPARSRALACSCSKRRRRRVPDAAGAEVAAAMLARKRRPHAADDHPAARRERGGSAPVIVMTTGAPRAGGRRPVRAARPAGW